MRACNGVTGAGYASVVVAVVDTGVEVSHPLIGPNMWQNEAEAVGDSLDNDNNGEQGKAISHHLGRHACIARPGLPAASLKLKAVLRTPLLVTGCTPSALIGRMLMAQFGFGPLSDCDARRVHR